VGHSFLKRSGTLGGNFATEEGDFGCFEDTLCRIDKDAVCLEPVEEGWEVVLVLFEGSRENEDVWEYPMEGSHTFKQSMVLCKSTN
jgi:hypothetical protein